MVMIDKIHVWNVHEMSVIAKRINLKNLVGHREHRDHREETGCCDEIAIHFSVEPASLGKPELSLCSLYPQGVGCGCLKDVLAPFGGMGLKPQQHTL